MCLAVYLAAGHPLAAVAWDSRAPAVCVEPLEGGGRELPALALPHRAYVGSHTGCACGFAAGGAAPGSEDAAATARDYAQLADYLEREVRGPAQIFVCWDGEEGRAVARRLTLRPADIRAMAEPFEEGDLIEVS